MKAVADAPARPTATRWSPSAPSASEIVSALDDMAGVSGVGLDKRTQRPLGPRAAPHRPHRADDGDGRLRPPPVGRRAPVRPHPRRPGADARCPGPVGGRGARALAVDHQRPPARALRRGRELDTAYAIPGKVRLRVNLFVQRGAVAASLPGHPLRGRALRAASASPPWSRPSPTSPRTRAGHRPDRLRASRPPWPRSSTWSTSVARPTSSPSRTRSSSSTSSKQALVNQREVGDDTEGFSLALTQALRQDPDVILVGEMRDLETVSTAISAAETGHLVFATLHTQDSSQTVDRIVDVFPAEQQAQVRTQLATPSRGSSPSSSCSRPTVGRGCRRARSCWPRPPSGR